MKNRIVKKTNKHFVLEIVSKKHGVFNSVFSIEDFDLVTKHNWSIWLSCKSKQPYVSRSVWGGGTSGRSTLSVAREILGIKKGDSRLVDHKDRDTLNNTRENLRICTRAENLRNRRGWSMTKSGIKGVYIGEKNSKNNKWRSTISVGGKSIYLGLFKNKTDAYKAYCEAAKKYHKEFACLPTKP